LNATLKFLSMRLRALTPSPVRSAHRILRSTSAQPASKALTPELVEHCHFFADRVHMLGALPRNGVVAELGTYRGDFARAIALNSDPRELHLVDIDFTHFIADGLESGRVQRHTGLTHEVIASFPDAYFDWIYIDADHAFSGVMRDAEASAPKVRPGGYLVFNDFAHIDPSLGRYGVHAAVTTFATEHRWPLRLFAFDASALYDVALRRPV
jgi:hypothetical protein